MNAIAKALYTAAMNQGTETIATMKQYFIILTSQLHLLSFICLKKIWTSDFNYDINTDS